MLRRHLQLLTLTLLSSTALAVPSAEAINITLITAGENIFCTDSVGTGTSCSKSISPSTVDLTDSGNNVNFELNATVPQGTWNVSITATDTDSSDTQSFAPISSDGLYYVAFAAFTGIDFTAIDEVELLFANSSAIGDSIEVEHFAAVPEPGTACLLTFGLLGLAAASPRRRIAA